VSCRYCSLFTHHSRYSQSPHRRANSADELWSSGGGRWGSDVRHLALCGRANCLATLSSLALSRGGITGPLSGQRRHPPLGRCHPSFQTLCPGALLPPLSSDSEHRSSSAQISSNNNMKAAMMSLTEIVSSTPTPGTQRLPSAHNLTQLHSPTLSLSLESMLHAWVAN
jgi:hypothetical protein